MPKPWVNLTRFHGLFVPGQPTRSVGREAAGWERSANGKHRARATAAEHCLPRAVAATVQAHERGPRTVSIAYRRTAGALWLFGLRRRTVLFNEDRGRPASAAPVEEERPSRSAEPPEGRPVEGRSGTGAKGCDQALNSRKRLAHAAEKPAAIASYLMYVKTYRHKHCL
jgi:hypothetical protein